MKIILFIIGVYLSSVTESNQEIDSKQLRCLVCRATLDELEGILEKIDPSIEIEVGNYRIDAQGNNIQKKVPLRQSEVHISDTLDSICEKMSDYVRATYKSNGQLTLLKLLTPSGGMNPEMSKVDIIQDSDMNKSLKFYCQGIVEEYEDSILPLYTRKEQNPKKALCTDIAELCTSEDFLFEEENDTEDDTRDLYDEL